MAEQPEPEATTCVDDTKSGISQARWTCLKAWVKQHYNINISGNSGTLNPALGVTATYAYDPNAQTLHITISAISLLCGKIKTWYSNTSRDALNACS